MAVVLVINDDQDMLSLYDAVIRDMGHRPVTKVEVDSRSRSCAKSARTP